MKRKILVVGNLAKDIIESQEFFGGSAGIIALGISWLGVKAGVLSVSASDGFSKSYLEYLQKNGVDISMVEEKLAVLPTCEILSDKNNNSSRRWTNNGSKLAMESLSTEKGLKGFNLIHLTSCPPNLARQIALGEVNISYEPGPRLNHDIKFLNLDVVSKSKLLFFNQEEYEVAKARISDFDRKVFDYGNLVVLVITLGKSGSRICFKECTTLRSMDIPVFKKTEKITDNTGAGDNYKAGFLAAFVQGRPLKECALIGTEMAFLCITQKGGILTEEKVKRIKNKYNFA